MSQDKRQPIQEYFSESEKGVGNELFRIDDGNSDIKSELSEQELRNVNVLMMNDDYLERLGIGKVYWNYYKRHLRLKVSLDRKGRSEFVQIHRKDNSDETIQKFGNMSNMLAVRK